MARLHTIGAVHATDGTTAKSICFTSVSWIHHFSQGSRDLLSQMVSSVRMVQDDQLVDMRWEDFWGQFGRVCDGFETILNQKDIQCVIHVYPVSRGSQTWVLHLLKSCWKSSIAHHDFFELSRKCPLKWKAMESLFHCFTVWIFVIQQQK